MKVTLCARDIGPCNVLRAIAEALKAKGLEVIEFYEGKESPVLSEDTEILILGMSSSLELAESEIFLARMAKDRNIRTVFVADTFGVWNRPWFSGVIAESGNLASIFVINEDEVQNVKETFPNARVTATGNPCWDKYFFPNHTKESARMVLGIDSDSTVMLCPFGKSDDVNLLLAKKAIEVASQTWFSQIIIGIHPGDKTPIGNYDVLSRDTFIPIRIVGKELMTGDDLVNVADLVVESASSVGIAAICNPRRIPVVTWFSDIALERLKKATGSDRWPLCEQEASFLYKGDADIDIVRALLNSTLEGHRERLEKLYPEPKCLGIALEKMMQEIV